MLGTVREGAEEGVAGGQEPVFQRCPHVSCSSPSSCFCHCSRQAAGLSIARVSWALPPFAQPPSPRHHTTSTCVPSICCSPGPHWGGRGVLPSSSQLFFLLGILLLAHLYLPDEVSVCPLHHSCALPLPASVKLVPAAVDPPTVAGASGRGEPP